jgi:2-hydroxycyclohexanecarboxyl-CoA dehydrogenase
VSRVAVVTGGASGIGLGVARRFVADGHRVAVLDRDHTGAEAAAADLGDRGGKAIAVEVDVADRASVDAAFARTRADLGPIEILVTSAGVESFDALLDITPETWDRIIAVNLTGTFACVQAAVPDMLAGSWGRIVTISSSSAQSGAPNMTHYTASEGGVIALTRSLAVELARNGITINTIPPSLVDTPMARQAEAAGDFPGVDVIGPMVPLGRAGTPDDIAAACSFLCSGRRQPHHRPGHRRQRRHVHLRDRGSRTLDSSRRVWEADGLPGGPHLADLLSFEPTGLPREARA